MLAATVVASWVRVNGPSGTLRIDAIALTTVVFFAPLVPDPLSAAVVIARRLCVEFLLSENGWK